MLSVLIVEDEQKVGLLIRALINWNELGLVFLGIMDNGKDALDRILAETPDIVITDIRMPQMDGLEVIRQTRARGLETKFIVISGYRHFEYVHQAIKYGIEDYLLKPINQNELNSILLKISDAKKHEIEQEKAEKIVMRELCKSRHILQRELAEKIIENSPDIRELNFVNIEYALNFKNACFQGLALKLDYKNPENTDITQNNLITDKVLEIITSRLEPLTIEQITVAKDIGFILCVLNFDENSQKTLNREYGLLLRAVQDYIFAFKDYEATLGIGNLVYRFERLSESVNSAIQALRYRIKLGIGEKIYFHEYLYENTETASHLIFRLQNSFSHCIEAFDSEKLKVNIEEAFQILSEHKQIDPGIYYELADELVRIFFDNLQMIDQKDRQKEKRDLQNQIPNIYNLPRLVEFLEENLCCLLEQCREQQISQDKKPILEAKRYLMEHYMEKVSLEDIAKVVNLNPVYFSVVFKKETGSNFSDYLVNLRVEAAKTLLRETNLTIMAIARKVGYEDTKYFSQLFKKLVGVNPGMYRKLYA